MGVPAWSLRGVSGNFGSHSTESTLDSQYLGAVAPNVSQSLFTTAGDELNWALGLLATPAALRADVYSISWGAPMGQLAAEHMAAMDEALAAIALLGITVVVASGDHGAAGSSEPAACASRALQPMWPAASRWVLAVGATQAGPSAAAIPPSRARSAFCQAQACMGSGGEVAASLDTNAAITSGGGFAPTGGLPSWQAAAVGAYLASSPPIVGAFNPAAPSGRALPDIAAFGSAIAIVENGQLVLVSGTSASAPIVAALLALANSERRRAGLPTLGFVNPALYAIAASSPHAYFWDVTSGVNTCTALDCGCGGFAAQAGWDPLTGLGTPRAAALVAALAALPAPPTGSPSPSPTLDGGTPTPSPQVSARAAPTHPHSHYSPPPA